MDRRVNLQCRVHENVDRVKNTSGENCVFILNLRNSLSVCNMYVRIIVLAQNKTTQVVTHHCLSQSLTWFSIAPDNIFVSRNIVTVFSPF